MMGRSALLLVAGACPVAAGFMVVHLVAVIIAGVAVFEAGWIWGLVRGTNAWRLAMVLLVTGVALDAFSLLLITTGAMTGARGAAAPEPLLTPNGALFLFGSACILSSLVLMASELVGERRRRRARGA